MRRRAAWFSIFCLSAAFLSAVQRDSFVRQWLVPRPTSPAEAKLGRPYPGAPPGVATLEQLVSDISLHAGVPVALANRAGLEQVGIDTAFAAHWHLRSSTAGAALTEACMNYSTPTVDLGFEAGGDAVLVGTADVLAAGHVVRVYDLTDLVRAERARHAAGVVPNSSARPADSESGEGSGAGAPDGPAMSSPTRPYWSPGQRRLAPFSDAAVVAALHESVQQTLYPARGSPSRAAGGAIRTAGGRLVVAHTAMSQRRVAVVIERITRDGFPPPSWCGN